MWLCVEVAYKESSEHDKIPFAKFLSSSHFWFMDMAACCNDVGLRRHVTQRLVGS